jgi:hypothetical protein
METILHVTSMTPLPRIVTINGMANIDTPTTTTSPAAAPAGHHQTDTAPAPHGGTGDRTPVGTDQTSCRNPLGRDPHTGDDAMTAAMLEDLSGDRFVLGIGANTAALAEGLHGVEFRAPGAKLRRTVEEVRALLDGDRASTSRAARGPDSGRHRCPISRSGSQASARDRSTQPPGSAMVGFPRCSPDPRSRR